MLLYHYVLLLTILRRTVLITANYCVYATVVPIATRKYYRLTGPCSEKEQRSILAKNEQHRVNEGFVEPVPPISHRP